jgi:uncharacterized membrane protein
MRRRWSAESLISTLLRVGVATSLCLVVLGTIVSFVHHPSYLSSPQDLKPLTQPGAAPSTLGEVAAGLAQLRGQAIVTLGLLLLVATPIARVSLSIVIFAREGDRRFVLITTLVLSLLIASFLLGQAGG